MTAMKYTLVAAALGMFGMAGSALAQSPMQQIYGGYGPGQLVTCESNDGRHRQCAMDTRGGVQIVRQISRAQCIQGRTWGTDRNGVWVNNGCRAQFASQAGNRGGGGYGYGQPNQGYGQSLRCESTNGRYRECAIDTRGGVQLVRQISGAQCIQGRSWGQTRNGVWVNHGCRAEFAVGMGPGRGYAFGRNQNQGRGNQGWGNQGWGQQQVIHCASDSGRQQVCPVQINRGVNIQRQVSRAQCIEGRSWGWDRRGVWVSNGCRADFAVY